ncbi:hypothetical protein scyTo_0010823 [Scyliorhinus torazame]|uniref:Uncharacterized protein n=1 Tax=Scyliorhinus torazame TaxID=75743 RepID=A0A401PBY8_SCYTO|nr:hypothetical protein [Scyliorhinus torazame]
MVRSRPFKYLLGYTSPKIATLFVLAILMLMGLDYLNIRQLRQVYEKHLRIYHHVNLKDLETIQEPKKVTCSTCPNYWLYAPRVNHFPGLGYITNKGSLVASNFSYIPKAFRMPEQKEEFILETKTHTDKLWVEKSNQHRGIKIMSLRES